MGPDDDADDDVPGFAAPLPPDDRLWRHPSELKAYGPGPGAPVPVSIAAPRTPNTRTVALVAGLVGAVLSAGVISLAGVISPRRVDRDVIQRVAVTPVVSSPMVRGDRGVVTVTKQLGPALVRLDVRGSDGGHESSGSGVLFRDDGLVLTSAHVVRDAGSISVVLSDGRHFSGRLIGVDGPTDVAVVDIDGNDLPVAVLGTARGLEVGTPAVALGSPRIKAGQASVASGVISALGSSVRAITAEVLHGMIQTDAPVAAGCSGGALVDATGAVIGITSGAAGGSDKGVAFATPIDVAHKVALQLVEHGRAIRGWLGVEGTDLPADWAERTGLSGGAFVRDVLAGSPADKAGLASSDVITEVDGHPVQSMPGLVVELRDHEPGDQVDLTYWRDGTPSHKWVQLDEQP
jgi:S1-C subfamily serine protease